ncbi:unnamed protein product [Caenorhabditis sp. 36 PRJEB53466]|nr:unnamed protein product [Caenorhabditis sp. 36 PRJEB53466]
MGTTRGMDTRFWCNLDPNRVWRAPTPKCDEENPLVQDENRRINSVRNASIIISPPRSHRPGGSHRPGVLPNGRFFLFIITQSWLIYEAPPPPEPHPL